MRSKIVLLTLLVLAALPAIAQRTTTPAPAAPAAAPAPDNTAVAREVVTALQANDFAKAESKFSPMLSKNLTQPKLKAQWEMVVKQYGAMKEIKSVGVTKIMNVDLTVVKCTFAKAAVDAQMAFDKQGRVTELYFKPAAK